MLLLQLARGWLGFLAVFELPAIYGHLITCSKVTGIFKHLKPTRGGAERRLWSMVLMLLVISRAVACAYPTKASLIHTSAVHTAEAVFFGAETLRYGGDCPKRRFSPRFDCRKRGVFFTYVACVVEG